MIDLVEQRDPSVPLKAVCETLEVSRATVYRHRQQASAPKVTVRKPRPPSPRRISNEERAKVLEELNSERFAEQPPREVYATLLDEGVYLASIRSMYRILAEEGASKERRNQRTHPRRVKPSLSASGPNQVWTWDITKLPTHVPGVFLNLYLVLDLWSRYPVAWMVAGRENSALAKQMFAEAISRYDIKPDQLIVHQDRGAPMTALGFTELLSELGVDKSYSRPRVSNDNPFSESGFKTLKYQPDYPGRFEDVGDARQWLTEFMDWYANDHHHSGLALYTPADRFFGRVPELAKRRQSVLDAAYEAHPERFTKGRPTVPAPPLVVAINPGADEPGIPPVTASAILAAGPEQFDVGSEPPTPPPVVLSLPGVTHTSPELQS